MNPNVHRNHFPMRHYVHTYTSNSELQVICDPSTYPMTALLLEMAIVVLELDARYDWRVMLPNTHHSLFFISHLYIISIYNDRTTFSSHVKVHSSVLVIINQIGTCTYRIIGRVIRYEECLYID